MADPSRRPNIPPTAPPAIAPTLLDFPWPSPLSAEVPAVGDVGAPDDVLDGGDELEEGAIVPSVALNVAVVDEGDADDSGVSDRPSMQPSQGQICPYAVQDEELT